MWACIHSHVYAYAGSHALMHPYTHPTRTVYHTLVRMHTGDPHTPHAYPHTQVRLLMHARLTCVRVDRPRILTIVSLNECRTYSFIQCHIYSCTRLYGCACRRTNTCTYKGEMHKFLYARYRCTYLHEVSSYAGYTQTRARARA